MRIGGWKPPLLRIGHLPIDFAPLEHSFQLIDQTIEPAAEAIGRAEKQVALHFVEWRSRHVGVFFVDLDAGIKARERLAAVCIPRAVPVQGQKRSQYADGASQGVALHLGERKLRAAADAERQIDVRTGLGDRSLSKAADASHEGLPWIECGLRNAECGIEEGN